MWIFIPAQETRIRAAIERSWYTSSSDVQTNVTNTATPWQTQISMFPDFLSGNVTDATLQVDVYSYGCLSRQVFGKDISGGTLRKQKRPAMAEETQQQADEDMQIYPVPASGIANRTNTFRGNVEGRIEEHERRADTHSNQ